MQRCPCGSGAGFETCCAPVIGGVPARTAETLMRSRYTAHVLRDFGYLERTHAAETRGSFDRSTAERMAGTVEWTGLEIHATSGGGEADDTGTVEFSARHKEGGQPHVLREISSFRREAGRWVYVDGLMRPGGEPRRAGKVGRNAPCPCGSGKKYKKCCGT